MRGQVWGQCEGTGCGDKEGGQDEGTSPGRWGRRRMAVILAYAGCPNSLLPNITLNYCPTETSKIPGRTIWHAGCKSRGDGDGGSGRKEGV
ncbi:hypothetical protein Pmani_036635 [Petrolisthes manimaculis]|uniref:Uncharacterized protein n=1 Tax=Petrolisthes manimaculis TaxID=1843537 RepID=A0AAE1NJ71_9EUCA|nr:hypothetical protein Pmani_036635 [Petrolisthes manimaculis]